MKKILFSFITVLSLLSTVINAQNTIFGCTDTAAANYDSTATQALAGLVEFPVQCNQNGWGGNYVGINLALYQAHPSEFAVGTKVTIAGHDYWIDAMNIPGNCNQGVALIYVAIAPGLADGNPWSPAGNVVQPVVPGDEWNITECFYNPGCMDDDYVEYDPNADWDDGSCQTLKLYGCTDSTALNYNPWANTDDGSCIADLNCGFNYVEIKVTIKVDNWPGETSWLFLHSNPNDSITDTTYYAPRGTYSWGQQGQTIVTRFCAQAGPNHLMQFVLQDSYGDGIRGSQPPSNSGFCLVENMSCPDTIFYMSEADADFGYITTSDPNYWSPREQFCGNNLVYPGCTDPAYQEYDPLATNDDGSCQNLHVYGCMDTNSVNYNPNHTAPDNIENCQYRLILEDDGGDGWGESFVGIKQGSQLWDYRLGPGTYVDTFYIDLIVEDNPDLQEPVEMYYFEIGDGQQSAQQIDIQTIQNSVKIENDYGVLLHEGNFPWANGNKLKNYQTTEDIYSAIPFCGYVCTPKIYGCTDSLAHPDSYDPEANTDNGSCFYYPECDNQGFVEFWNADSNLVDHWSIDYCYTPAIFGCMDNTSYNYNSTANVELPNTCVPFIYGCTNPLMQNYNAAANTDDGSCVPYIFGCTDPTSFNYDSTANTDNGSCIPVVFGCIDPTMFNYDPMANTDNGSCIPIVLGCMDPTATNYNPNANVDDGSCIPYVYGCTDSTSFNYNPLANTDDGSCIPFIYGCTNPTSYNYDSTANVDNGSCVPFAYGCTDSTAFNYDPLANTDDGSCIPIVYGCTDPSMFNYDPLANTDDGSCIPIVYGCMDNTMFNYNPNANVDNGSCIPFIYGCTDSTAFNYDPLANTDNGTCIPVIYGCTDPSAFNFNPLANTEDFSCIPVVYGCTDSLAVNYDSTANVDNGSCITAVPGCTDPNAYNFNPNANVPDSATCLYDAGCITGPGNPYWLNDDCYAWVISVDPYCCNVTWDANCQSTYDYCASNSGWVGVEDLIYDGGIAIYPNPTTGKLNVVSSRIKNVLVTIYSVSGQVVVNETSESVIDISHLEDGVYFMNVKVGELTYTRKVIKQ